MRKQFKVIHVSLTSSTILKKGDPKERVVIEVSSSEEDDNSPTGSKRGREDEPDTGPLKKAKGKDVDEPDAGPPKKFKGKGVDKPTTFHHSRPLPKKLNAKLKRVRISSFLLDIYLLRNV